MAAAPDPAYLAAKKTLATTCDHLTSRSTYFPIFDESKGSVDYARWRRDLFTFVGSAGVDFTAALEFVGHIAPTPAYNPAAEVNRDNAGGIVTYSMPQMRQLALLSVIRRTLSPAGESAKIVRECRHAGGIITDAHGVHDDQALVRLDRRWQSAVAAAVDFGQESASLHAMKWPVEFSADAYNTFFNAAVSHATKSNVNPNDDGQASMDLRKTWWYVFTVPPVGSPYFEAARHARAVTRNEDTTVAHRTAWRDAIIDEIGLMVKAGNGKPSSGLARKEL